MPDDVQGILMRSVDDLVKAMGMTGISKSQVSRLCGDIDGKVQGFLNRPLEGLIRMETVPRDRSPGCAGDSRRGQRPYLRIDAPCAKVRQNGRIVPVAAIIAVGVNSDGRRKVPGLGIGACGACGGAAVYGTPACSALPFRTGFLRKLTRRGLRGVKPVISDAH